MWQGVPSAASRAALLSVLFVFLRVLLSPAWFWRIREVYERAIANKPPKAEKRFWKRYIYLW
eukprot:911636-Amphidinium_carterae.1